MSLTEKQQIYYNVWSCAYQRRYMYRHDPQRYEGEHSTILMCLQMKDAKWWHFDTEGKKFL